MSEELNTIIKEYSQNPLQHFPMQDASVSRHEGNFICWDEITVYLKIKDNKIENYSFDGNCSTITLAASSFLSEFIMGASLDDVLSWTYTTMVDHWFEVSPRRKRAAVIAIMWARNAIHDYLQDGKEDVFDDLLDD